MTYTFSNLWAKVHFSIITKWKLLYIILHAYITILQVHAWLLVSTIEAVHWDFALATVRQQLPWPTFEGHRWIYKINLRFVWWHMFCGYETYIVDNLMHELFHSPQNQVSLTIFEVTVDFDLLHWNTLCWADCSSLCELDRHSKCIGHKSYIWRIHWWYNNWPWPKVQGQIYTLFSFNSPAAYYLS